MSGEELSILIKIQSDLAAGKDATELLKQLNTEAQITAASMKGGGEAAGEAGKEIEFLGLKGHEAHMALRLLGGQLGEVGHLLHFIFSPELVGIAGLVIALKMAVEQFKALADQAEKNIELNKELKRIHTDALDESSRAAKAEMAAYDLRLQHQFDGEDRLKKATEERLKLYDAEQDHIKSLIDLEAGRFNAYIAFLVKTGKLTPEQGDEAKEAEKKRVEDAKERTDELKAASDIHLKTQERARDKNSIGGVDANIAGARGAAHDADEVARENTKRTEFAQKRYEETEAAAKEAEKKLTALLVGHKIMSGDQDATIGEKYGALISFIGQGGQAPKSVAEDAKRLRATADEQYQAVQSLKDHQVTLDEAVKASAASVKEWEDKKAKLIQSVNDLSDAIDNATAELNAKHEGYYGAGGTQESNARNVAAAQYYRTGPHDAESDALFGLGRSGTSTNAVNAGIGQVVGEIKTTVQNTRNGTDDRSQIHATLQHVLAVLASNVNLTTTQQSNFVKWEADLTALEAKLQRQANGQPNFL